MRRNLKVLFVVCIGIMLAWLVLWQYNSRPIPFNAAKWQSGGPRLRFRMKDSLQKEYDAGRLVTREQIDSALGPGRPIDAPLYYYRLTETGIPTPWYVKIYFNDDNSVRYFMIAPD